MKETALRREAVLIARKARGKAVLLSLDEYQRLQALEARETERRFHRPEHLVVPKQSLPVVTADPAASRRLAAALGRRSNQEQPHIYI